MSHFARSTSMLLLVLPLALAAGDSRPTRAASAPPPSKLVLIGTTDLRGETSPCGCHTPRGGFARISSVVDSVRRSGAAMVYLDAGGAFPDLSTRMDLADFMYSALRDMAPGAVGVAPRDLQLGLSAIRRFAADSRLPMTCANLLDRATRAPLFPPTRIVELPGLKVGVFALLGERFELGAARDSVVVIDAESAAHVAVTSLREQGSQVIVLLSQLGRVGGEDLATAVPGIDAVFLGHDVPVLEHGRRVGGSLVSYAGERGQQIGMLQLSLDGAGRVGDGTCDVISLGPDVRQHAAMLARVKQFEDAYNERMRHEQRLAQAADEADTDPIDHFVGGAVCARCHTAEAAQWITTAHSLAWETLVREKKDATPDCIPCHVVGFRKAGGFQSATSTPHLVNVQCENCHGMGTTHGENWVARSGPTEGTCRTCHSAERDPEFDFATRLPLVTHGNTSGESIRNVKARRERYRSGASR